MFQPKEVWDQLLRPEMEGGKVNAVNRMLVGEVLPDVGGPETALRLQPKFFISQ